VPAHLGPRVLLHFNHCFHWLKAPEKISYKVAVLVYQCHHGLNYDDQQTLKPDISDVVADLELGELSGVWGRSPNG